MNAEERRFAVLRAIVADFVRTHEPVGSKMIVDRHNLGVSSATVRNDMAALEDEGLIVQPHTSAGRIPTDKGYRLFVDQLAQVKPLSPAERRAMQAFLDGAIDLDDVLRRSVRLLAQLTRQVAVVQYPTLSRSTVRHLEVVALTPARLMLVLITDTGRVDQRVVDLGEVLTDDDVGALRAMLNAALVGQPLAAASARASPSCPRTAPGELRGVVTTLSVGAGRVAGRAPRGTPRARRHRQPHPQRGRLPDLAARGARGAGGAGRRAAAAHRGAATRAPSRCGSARRTRPRRCAPTSIVSIGYGRRPPALWAAWASSGPPAWTTRARSRRCGPSRATWGRSWQGADRPSDASTGCEQDRRRRTMGTHERGHGLLRDPRREPGATRPERSSGRTASSPASCIPTSTPTAARSASRGQEPPTRCSPTPRSGASSTSAATPWPPASGRRRVRRLRFGGRLRRARRHHGRLLRRRRRGGRGRGPRGRVQPGEDALIRIAPHARGVRGRGGPGADRRHRGALRAMHGLGRRRAGRPTRCDTCGGRGEVQNVQRSFIGQVVTARPCPVCRGLGEIIPDPCQQCGGDGRVRARRTVTVRSRPASPTACASGWPARARSAPAAARRATSTSRSTRSRTTSSPATAPTCTATSRSR